MSFIGSDFMVVFAKAYKITGKKSTVLERRYDCRYIGSPGCKAVVVRKEPRRKLYDFEGLTVEPGTRNKNCLRIVASTATSDGDG